MPFVLCGATTYARCVNILSLHLAAGTWRISAFNTFSSVKHVTSRQCIFASLKRAQNLIDGLMMSFKDWRYDRQMCVNSLFDRRISPCFGHFFSETAIFCWRTLNHWDTSIQRRVRACSELIFFAESPWSYRSAANLRQTLLVLGRLKSLTRETQHWEMFSEQHVVRQCIIVCTVLVLYNCSVCLLRMSRRSDCQEMTATTHTISVTVLTVWYATICHNFTISMTHFGGSCCPVLVS